MQSYRGIRVLVTGHTGFKGSWLCTWLKHEGAVVSGLALAPEEGRPSLFDLARIGQGMTSTIGDIRDFGFVERVFDDVRPQIVFHLAAQALVRRSYRDPLGTFATNLMGTVHVLEAARHCDSVQAIVCVTTDKVYEDRQWPWPYRENDHLGGNDPYSASKSCAEFAATAYRETMLPFPGSTRLATARGGNVIGGGDWSEDRIVPDIMRAIEAGAPVTLRNPGAIRPWQHVLELVNAYLHLGGKLLAGAESAVGCWNFGPEVQHEVSVESLVRAFLLDFGQAVPIEVKGELLKESRSLRLDVSKARQELDWKPVLNFAETVAMTADWYRRFIKGKDALDLTLEQISHYDRKRA